MKSRKNVKSLPLKRTSVYTLPGEWRRAEFFCSYILKMGQWRESTKFQGTEWGRVVVELRNVHSPTNGTHPMFATIYGSRYGTLFKWNPVYLNLHVTTLFSGQHEWKCNNPIFIFTYSYGHSMTILKWKWKSCLTFNSYHAVMWTIFKRNKRPPKFIKWTAFI